MAFTRDGTNTPAIVVWRKKHKLYSVFTFITPGLGIIQCSMPHKRLQSFRSGSYLRPFSGVYITVVLDGEYMNLTQVDGSYIVESLDTDLTNISYASIAGELILKLFAMYDVDRNVFNRVVQYSKSIRTKSVRLGTIILGWQLLSLAGLTPSIKDFESNNGVDVFFEEIYEVTGKSVGPQLRNSLPQVLSYDWGETTALELGKYAWQELEQLLYQYATHQFGEPMQSVQFLINFKN